jgi:hypothetical protein
VDIRASGQQDLFRLAHALNTAADKGLKRELDQGSRQAGNVIAAAVQDHTEVYIPRAFEAEWRRTMKTKVDVRLIQQRRISVRVWADGKATRRDIVSINKGDLAHPVYGRFRRLRDGSRMRNPWVARPGQPIRPGLVDEPAARVMPQAIQKIEDAVNRVTKQIERG